MKKYLSKTNIISQLRCPKKLWLEIHKPDLSQTDPESPMLFNGNLAGVKARELFDSGILVNWRGKDEKFALSETKKLMENEKVHTIYEGTFLNDGVLVRADIMIRTEDGWDLIEVKSTTKLTKHHYDDVAIQYFVIKGAGVTIAKTMLMYVNKEFVYQGDDNYSDLFKFEEVNDKCEELSEMIANTIVAAKLNVSAKEPHVEMAPMCKHDFICPAKKYCDDLAPFDHISFLPRGGTVQKKIAVDGLTRITEIPNGLLKSETHKMVYDVTMADKELYIKGAKEIIDALPYPHHYLDFESVQFSVPYWKGVRAWRQVPFQWSDHVHYENGDKGYEKFLDVSGNDPRRAFADSVIAQCSNDQGAVLVYNAAFERMILMDLLVDFPDIAEELESIRSRCFDLLPLMKKHFYNKKMRGSWSIKKVMTCFVEDMNYADLTDVQDGLAAQKAYLNLINPEWQGDKIKLKENALEYCKYDTLSMVRLVEGINSREK